jgi:hypothetical protein
MIAARYRMKGSRARKMENSWRSLRNKGFKFF